MNACYKIRTCWEQQMAAAQTKGHEEDQHTEMQGEKIRNEKKNEKRKVGSKAQKQARKSYSRRLHSNKSSRLCYKAETGTLPHHLPSSGSRRQRYQVSLLMRPHKIMLYQCGRVLSRDCKGFFFSPTVLLFSASANGGHHPDPEP